MNNLAEKYKKILICQYILPKIFYKKEEKNNVPDFLSCEKVMAYHFFEANMEICSIICSSNFGISGVSCSEIIKSK